MKGKDNKNLKYRTRIFCVLKNMLVVPLQVFFLYIVPLTYSFLFVAPFTYMYLFYILGPLHVFCFIRYGWGWRAPVWVEFCHGLLQNCKGFSISPLKLLHPCPSIGFERVTYTQSNSTAHKKGKGNILISTKPLFRRGTERLLSKRWR